MPRGIEVVEGADGVYLFDGTQMTGPYAHWAFLAAEGDPVATFACCVRDESRRIYPRPDGGVRLRQRTLAHGPRRRGRGVGEGAFDAGIRQVIRCTSASNGDVYFYSKRFLDDDHAASLAEWSSVGKRFMNV